MSDTQKPVEGTPATTAAPESTPAPEAKPTEITSTDKPAESTPVAKEEPIEKEKGKAAEAKVEATPASEGVLGHKATPFPKNLLFSKRYFWFSDDALEAQHLTGYHKTDKPDTHSNAAWAGETGKGLLFFAKRAEDKTHPTGIINLADIGDIAKEGDRDFSFFLSTHKHTFQAENTSQRASWIVAIETKAQEAKEMKDSITGSEGYKKNFEKYSKPAAAVVPAASSAKTESSTPKPQEKAKDAIKRTKTGGSSSSSDEGKKENKSKSRSQSRKRGSVFGTLLGKKDQHEEKKETKKEEKAEEKAEKKEEPTDAKAAEPAAATEATTAATVAPATETTEEKKDEAPKAEETKAEAVKPETPAKSEAVTPAADKKSKRTSIFGSFFPKKDVTSPTAEKTEKDVAPAVPEKDKEVPPVSDTAPKLDEPVTTKPIDTAAVTAPVDAENKENKEVKETPTETGTSPSSKGGFMGFIKKQEAKLDSKKEGKKEEKAEESAAPATSEAAVTSEPAKDTSATETPAAKEKRRTSLFGNLGTMKKKEKSEATSDAEGTDGEKKTSTANKLGGIFRKPSKAVKSDEKKATPATSESKPIAEGTEGETKPEPVTKDEPTTNGPTETKSEAIGDVVPEAVNTAPEVKASA